MRSIVLRTIMLLGCLGIWATLPANAQAQSAAGTPDYAQPNYSPGDWTSHFYGPPYYNWRGQNQWHGHQWMWQEGRSFYPGYRYSSYPQYGTRVYGGGHYSFEPGYYYPRQQ